MATEYVLPRPSDEPAGDQPPAEAPVDATPAPETVSKADFDQVVAELGSLKAAYGEAGKRLAVIDKVAEMLTGGKQDASLSDNDQAVVKELHRILPELEHLKTLPGIKQAIESTGQAAATALTQAAFGYQLELQAEAGIKTDDQEANYLVGGAIKDWINMDSNRRARFWRGDKAVVKEGFETVRTKLLGPARRQTTADTLRTVASRPHNGAPGGGSQGAGSEPPTVDFRDPKAVRAAFRTALGG